MHMSGRSPRQSLLAVLLILALLLPGGAALADGSTSSGPAPIIIPVLAPRLSPPPIPNSSVLNPHQIWNDVIASNLPAHSAKAASVAKADGLKNGDPGILKKTTNIANGTTLNYLNAPAPVVCNDFNKNGNWASSWGGGISKIDPWTDRYAGWGPYAANDGYYQAKNVTFSKENVVGPGRHYDDDGTSSAVGDTVDGRHSAKIASTQPYIAGFISPVFTAAPGASVRVVVHYLIYNHGNIAHDKRWDYDSVSLAVAPDGNAGPAQYVNGYTRGQWHWMENTITVGEGGEFLVMIQGQSPAAINSNVYFDDISIYVDGAPMTSCY